MTDDEKVLRIIQHVEAEIQRIESEMDRRQQELNDLRVTLDVLRKLDPDNADRVEDMEQRVRFQKGDRVSVDGERLGTVANTPRPASDNVLVIFDGIKSARTINRRRIALVNDQTQEGGGEIS